jgi:hypothetical protein
MTLDAKNYKGRRRNPKWERDLARDLKPLGEAERLQFLTDLLEINQVVALHLARKCLLEKKSFESLLEIGLQKADPSTIQDWLKCVLPRLGARHVVRYLHKRHSEYPKAVAHARYWLPGLLTNADRANVDLTLLQGN